MTDSSCFRVAFARGATFPDLNTFKDRFRLQDHSFAAAEWAVIHGAVLVFGKDPQVLDVDFDQPGFFCPPDNPEIEWATKEVGEYRNNLGPAFVTQGLVVSGQYAKLVSIH